LRNTPPSVQLAANGAACNRCGQNVIFLGRIRTIRLVGPPFNAQTGAEASFRAIVLKIIDKPCAD
jgi:hypothetical protein